MRHALVALIFLAALCYGQSSLNNQLPPPCEVVLQQQGYAGQVLGNYVSGQYTPGLAVTLIATAPTFGAKCADSVVLGYVIPVPQADAGLIMDGRFYRPVQQYVLPGSMGLVPSLPVTVVVFQLPVRVGMRTATLMVKMPDMFWGQVPGQWLVSAELLTALGSSSSIFPGRVAASGGAIVRPPLGTTPEIGAVMTPTVEGGAGSYRKVSSIQMTKWSGGPATLASVHLKFDGQSYVFLARNGVFITPIQTTEVNGDVTFQMTQPVDGSAVDVYALVLPAQNRRDVRVPQIAAPLCPEDMVFSTGQGGFVLLSNGPRPLLFRFK